MLRGLLGGFARGRRQTSAATLVLDFLAGLNDSRITYSGGANGTRVNSSGVIVAATTPRFDYDPVTLAAKGLLVEAARTNSLRNNSMVGAAAGSPGTMPTNWNATGTAGVVTRTVVGSGTESGIPYVDVRYQFSGAGSATLGFEQTNQVAALNTQVWTASSYVKLVGGGFTGLAVVLFVNEMDAGGSFLVGSSTSITPTSAALITQRPSHTRTLNNASTAYLFPGIFFNASAAADITLRIGYPQAEQGAFMTSAIATTAAAAGRTADSAVMTGTNFSSWYNQSEGTFVVRTSVYFPSAYKTIIQVDDGSTNNRIYHDIDTGQARTVATVSGVNQGLCVLGAVSANTVFGVAGSYKVNDYAASLNGGTPVADTTGSVPMVNTFRIGVDVANYINGHIRSIVFYPSARPGSLQALSS